MELMIFLALVFIAYQMPTRNAVCRTEDQLKEVISLLKKMKTQQPPVNALSSTQAPIVDRKPR